MNLKALIDRKNIILNLNIESKKRLIEFFANRLADTHPEVDEDNVIRSVYQRERIGNTYIGKNIYIPHCRVEGLITTKIIIATLKNSYYDDIVNEEIKIAVGVFFPYKISKIHIELLKQLAFYLKDVHIQKYFEGADNADTLYKLIVKNNDT
ncbi:phosphotransferase IIA-like nitrogen-regulatory protein PtsN [Allofrancisella inopinata]|uniref:PTS sugar transporter subunit IIA n=1 Tax=Allofrancisella inopinata TaxID=1085647 RepID=A0AAE6YGS2_9GAMM|nr:PTS sugar transporter subunit IIA [Allofrancisella inopinata]QIV95635.1 PTS sugar transporter subunit IIA [Allofrancisella inopinata]TDT67460.1 phosphotransferase IIA-like nitrogen-regulatory protein PtsN [Allofrancisella inopinata]